MIEQIKKRLEQLGITQTQLANRVSVGRSSLSFWLAGKRPIPERHLTAIIKALDGKLIAAHIEWRPAKRGK